jgi:hypothetical protein
MKTIKVLAVVRQSVSATKRTDDGVKEFGLVSVKPLASKVEDGVWVKPEVSESANDISLSRVAISKFDTIKHESTLVANNVVLITLEEHIAGETSYDKKGVDTKHLESGWYVSDIEQAIFVDVLEVHESVDMSAYMSALSQGIRQATEIKPKSTKPLF